MNIFIDYYHQILTFFFKSGVCHLSGDGRGERWVPHSFFLYNLIRNSCEKTHQKQDELKVRTILQIFSSISTLYISAVSPTFVVLEPNLQDMLTTVQGACTLHFVCFFFFFATILGPDYYYYYSQTGLKKECEHVYLLCFRTLVNFLTEISVLHPG